ncbi:MAG: L,D-transpeptidase family protein [Nevskia sp.]|nr:L,D-transpeptidase family protein [Nevskia sp.]
MLRQLCCAVLGLCAAGFAVAEGLTGRPASYTVQPGDTLLDVARRFDVGYAGIRAANPQFDPWVPPVDEPLLLPTQHIVPAGAVKGILINVAELRLYYFMPDGSAVLSFPLGIGREGWQTPLGGTRVARKVVHPVWVPTPSERTENPDLPASVAPGPDNPMGDYALYLARRGYAIHGTNRPFSIGRRDSHGCIRLYPEDIARLYALAGVGTPVTVVDQPVKLGWQDGELYLEVHAGQAGADALEQGLEPPSPAQDVVDAMVRGAAGAEVERVNWDTVHLTAQQMRGMPVQVTARRN